MKFNKGIIGIIIGFAVLAAGLAGLSVYSNVRTRKEFVSDGYILDASVKEDKEAISEISDQIYFASGAQYKEKFGKQVTFKNTSNESVELTPEQFIHYSDESLGSFVKGVIMDLAALKEDQYGYYSVTKNTILVKNGNNYEMTSRGEKITMPEFLWKISDTDYTIVSPSITINLGTNYEVVLEGYAQIKYIDNGIVRIVHQQGTYQTVSSDAYLETADGAVLNLAGKNFYVEDKPVLSLDSIAINNNDYFDVDENIDAPTIPTFNVVNGADGQNGVDGEIGEDGEIGATGEDGFEGTQGAQGAQGQAGSAGTNGDNGASGKAGNDGTDGVEGEIGEMGRDGKNGVDGKDAESSDDIKVNNNAQPEVTMDTGSYKVTAGAANIKLSMTDLDNSLVQPDGSDYPFTIKMYNKQTMEEIVISDPNTLSAMQTNLMNGTPVTLNVKDLSPDTEYLLQVVGSHEVEDGQIREVVFYNKSFRTEAIGLELFKKDVSDHDFTLGVNKNNSDIDTYVLNVYKEHDLTGEPIIPSDNPMVYSWKKSDGSASSEYLFATETPIGTKVDSNTQYFASLSGISDVGGSITVDYSLTEIAFKTLKEKPYESIIGGDGNEQKVQIPAIMPALHKNEKTGCLELEAPVLVDKDAGIVGYRYEIHKVSNTVDEAINPEPAYVIETNGREVANFQLPPTDKDSYVGKVVVIFNDNEKTVEYSTAYSETPVKLEGNVFPTLIWDIQDANVQHDKIEGSVTIVDDGNICTLSPDAYAYLIIRSEYDDEVKLPITPTNCVESVNPHRITYTFNVDSLRTKNLYNLSVIAPVNTDGDLDSQGNNIITGPEKTTYLGGTTKQTTDNKNKKLAIVGEKLESGTEPFVAAIRFTTSKTSVDGVTKADKEYQATVLDSVTLELYQVTGEGANRRWDLLGSPKVYNDEEPYDSQHHESVYHSKYWVDSDDTTLTAGKGLALKSSYVGDNSGALIVTAGTFDLPINRAELYSGGDFVIRIKQDETIGEECGTDYTKATHANKIYFEDGQSEYWFTVAKKHVQAPDNNNEVEVRTLTKNMVNPNGYPNLDKDTAVGLQIKSNYKYTDAKEITYYIYEVDPEKSSLIGEKTSLYPDMVNQNGGWVNGYVNGPASTVNGYLGIDGSATNANASNLVAKLEDGTQVANLVAYATIENLGSQSGNIERIRLLFDGNKFVTTTGKYGNLKGGGDTWTLVDPDYKFERGKQYFVAYSVLSNNKEIDCDDMGVGKGVDDIYPFCTYNTLDKVPYYRSPLVTVDRQVPKVERYLNDNAGYIASWMYRINDPDYALTDGNPAGSFNIIWAQSTKATTDTTIDFNDESTFTFTENWQTDSLPISKFVQVDADGNRLFAEYKMGKVFNHYYYYRSSYSYKLNNVSSAKTVVSEPVLLSRTMSDVTSVRDKLKTTTVNDNNNVNVLMVGEPAAMAEDGTITYEPTIVDDGGYRYRLALRSGINTLKRIAALRVTIGGYEDQHANDPNYYHEVVYDPVYITVQNNSKVLDSYKELQGVAYAYLDTGALKEMVDSKVIDANVSVQAYYANGIMGMKTTPTNITSASQFDTAYKAQSAITTDSDGNITADAVNQAGSFIIEKAGYTPATPNPTTPVAKKTNLYAIMQMQEGGNSAYSVALNGSLNTASTNASDRIARVRSIFVPGSKGQVGFNPYEGYLAGRYAPVPMCSNANEYKLDTIHEKVAFNETGMLIGNDYYVVENLSVIDINFYNPADSSVNISAILPAVRLTNANNPKMQGAKTITPIFEALGTGANSQTKIYVRVFERTGKEDNANDWSEVAYTVSTDTNGTTVYTVNKENEGRYDALDVNTYANYEGKHISLKYDAVTGRYELPTSIRNLKPENEYRVKLFTYIKDGDNYIYKELYSEDKSVVGYEYPFKTRDKVNSTIGTTPKYTYDSYNDGTDATGEGQGKYVEFEFNVDGDDGTGIDVYYQLLSKADGSEVTALKKLPYVSETMQYYSQDPAKNHKLTFSFDPASEVRCGGEYTVHVVIKDRTDEGAVLGEANQSFKAPGLSDPSFTVSRSINRNANGNYDVNVSVMANNAMHSVVNDEYKIYIYPYGQDKDADASYLRRTVKLNRGDTNPPMLIKDALTDLPQGAQYMVSLVADLDTNNDGIVDKEMVEDCMVYITPVTSATLFVKATKNAISVEFSSLNNFANVDHIAYKISRKSNGLPIAESTINVSELDGYMDDGSHTILTLNLDGLNLSGDIVVNVQYLAENNDYLGDDDGGATVGNSLMTLAPKIIESVANTQAEAPTEEAQENKVSAEQIQAMMPEAGVAKVMGENNTASKVNSEAGVAELIENEVSVDKQKVDEEKPKEPEAKPEEKAGEPNSEKETEKQAIPENAVKETEDNKEASAVQTNSEDTEQIDVERRSYEEN